jgi:hypothetical protein
MAKQPEGGEWVADGTANIKASYADCAFQCAEDAACHVGTYLSNGECWLSSEGHHGDEAGVCGSACYSFVKSHDNEGEPVSHNVTAYASQAGRR